MRQILIQKKWDIIKKQKSSPLKGDAGYVFPILMAIHDTLRKIDTRIVSYFDATVNAIIPGDIFISAYVKAYRKIILNTYS